jgi:hypothetical protein
MNLKENVANYASLRARLESKKEIVSQYKKEYEEKTADIVDTIKDLENQLASSFSLIETDIKAEFEKDKTVKKFYGGFGVQEKKKITYDFDTALQWAKEKNMFVTLDVSSFEKAVEGMKLDFVTIDKVPQVTKPKEIKLD